jgi:DinB superfamily
LSVSAKLLEQWNEIGRKLVAIAEDLPEDKYDYKPNAESRSFIGRLLHVSGSMYYFTDVAQGKKPRYDDDPKRDGLKTKAEVVAFVKQCVKDGGDYIKSRGDKGVNEAVNDGSARMIRLGDLAYETIEHSGEHYGQLVVYYRINVMVPPESQPKK